MTEEHAGGGLPRRVEELREIAMRAGADDVGLVAVDREVTLAPGARLQVGPTVVEVSVHGN